MAPLGWVVVALCSIVAVSGAKPTAEELHQELIELRSKSSDGVLSFSDDQLKLYGAAKGRPYTFVVFLDALQVRDNPQLGMVELRQEFGMLSKAFLKGPSADNAFFIEMLFEDSPKIFRATQANQVPFIFQVSPSKKVSFLDGAMVPDRDQKLAFDTMGQAKYPWKAEDMAAFCTKAWGLEFGEVYRPTLLNNPWTPYVAVLLLVGGTAALYFMWWTPLIQSPVIWAFICVAVTWFSVSGGMYNIIRGVPLFIRDKEGQMQFFVKGKTQLGGEGFLVGTGYVLFSGLIALLTYGIPCISFKKIRMLLSYAVVAASSYLIFQIFKIYMAKTGYKITSYLL